MAGGEGGERGRSPRARRPPPAREEEEERQTPWLEWLVGDVYHELWKAILRPKRCLYSLRDLGPTRFTLAERPFVRKDLQLPNSRGHVLQCSHFLPAQSPEAERPCVVYLHGNSSSRLEALDVVPVLLPLGLTVFCLDLSGSGLSGGEYVTLGHHEEKDLCVALRHLRKSGTVTSVGLWGRSMGAATAILRAAKDRCLAACVLDSPFRDLRTVAEELVANVSIPQFMIDSGIEMVRSEVKSRAGFDPDQVLPIRMAPKARCPALFGAAQDDSFVLPHHAQDLHEAWGGEKSIRLFAGDHNSERPDWFLEEAAAFLAGWLHPEGPEGRLKVKPLRSRSRPSVGPAAEDTRALEARGSRRASPPPAKEGAGDSLLPRQCEPPEGSGLIAAIRRQWEPLRRLPRRARSIGRRWRTTKERSKKAAAEEASLLGRRRSSSVPPNL